VPVVVVYFVGRTNLNATFLFAAIRTSWREFAKVKSYPIRFSVATMKGVMILKGIPNDELGYIWR
jgi:hypothetical protein